MVSIITKWLLIFVRGPSIRSTSSSPLTSAVLRASSEDIRIFGEAFPRRLTYFWFSETRLNRNKILIKYKISRNLKSPQKREFGPPLSWRVYCIKLQGMVMSCRSLSWRKFLSSEPSVITQVFTWKMRPTAQLCNEAETSQQRTDCLDINTVTGRLERNQFDLVCQLLTLCEVTNI